MSRPDLRFKKWKACRLLKKWIPGQARNDAPLSRVIPNVREQSAVGADRR